MLKNWIERIYTATRKKLDHTIKSLKIILFIAVSFVNLFVTTCAQAPKKEEISNIDAKIGFWAGEDFLPNGKRDLSIYTSDLWDLLASYRIPIYVNFRYKHDFGPVPKGEKRNNDALTIIREANIHNVPVWVWMLVPGSDGYFAWQGNAYIQFEAIKALKNWQIQTGIHLEGVAFDPEPTPAYQAAFFDAKRGKDTTTLMKLTEQNINPIVQCNAIVAYDKIYAWTAAHFSKVIAAPFLASLDDIADGNIALQNASGYWGLPRGAQILYFQVYRSIFASEFGIDPGSSWIASYLQRAQINFGMSRGMVTLGEAGSSIYKEIDTLINDIRLVVALGAHSIPIYSLEKAVKAYRLIGIKSIILAARDPMSNKQVMIEVIPTIECQKSINMIRHFDSLATKLTSEITKMKGHWQLPNTYPNGCANTKN